MVIFAMFANPQLLGKCRAKAVHYLLNTLKEYPGGVSESITKYTAELQISTSTARLSKELIMSEEKITRALPATTAGLLFFVVLLFLLGTAFLMSMVADTSLYVQLTFLAVLLYCFGGFCWYLGHGDGVDAAISSFTRPTHYKQNDL